MDAQDRSRRHRTDFRLDAALDRLRFARIRHDSNDFFSLQNLTYRHGNRLPWNFRDIREPGLAYLLAAAGFIEADDKISVFRLEIRRWIVERQMAVFLRCRQKQHPRALNAGLHQRGGQLHRDHHCHPASDTV